MYKSKLQMCIEILCTLASSGSLKLTQLTHKVKLEKISLAAHLGFLYDRGLVGEGNLDEDERSYFVTERGLSVLKVVGPLIREAQRIEILNFWHWIKVIIYPIEIGVGPKRIQSSINFLSIRNRIFITIIVEWICKILV